MRFLLGLATSCIGVGLLALPATAVEPDIPAQPISAADVPGIEFSRRLADYAWRGDFRPLRQSIAAYYERQGNKPVWMGSNGFNDKAKAVISEISKAGEWGLKASDYTLPAEPGSDPDAQFEAEVQLTIATVKYARDARGGRYDPSRLSLNIDRTAPVPAPDKVLASVVAAPDAGVALRGFHPQHPQFEKLRQLWLKWRDATPEDIARDAGLATTEEAPEKPGKKARRKAAAEDPRKLASRLLYNMEMWRWMPEQLGDYHIVANLPEYKFRIVKAGRTVHEERIIVGKPNNQTPIFSDDLETVVFHPFWNVPDSIKVKELLPGLMRGHDSISRQGLRVKYGSRDIHPSSIDWSSTDIRNYHVYQPPGRGNALGIVKFLFPNRHHVYMHDTPTKHLFSQSSRAFSHGCMRVRNPVRFAEIVLAHDKGWTPEKVKSVIAAGEQDNNITLDRKIPIHVTYFTAHIDEHGKPVFYRDMYGHERLIQMGIDGKASQIVLKKENLGQIAGRSRRGSSGSIYSDFFQSPATYTSSSSSRDRSWANNAFSRD